VVRLGGWVVEGEDLRQDPPPPPSRTALEAAIPEHQDKLLRTQEISRDSLQRALLAMRCLFTPGFKIDLAIWMQCRVV
jgi:hypothetical protein